MQAMPGQTKHISLRVQDQHGKPHAVRLAIAEQNESGTLSILTPTGEVSRKCELTSLKKSKNATRLDCQSSAAKATLYLKRDKEPSELHISVRIFFMTFNAVYYLDRAQCQRLVAWIRRLSIRSIE
jgi:hypothetical protein